MWLKILPIYTYLIIFVGVADLISAGSSMDPIRAECMHKYSHLKEEDVFGSFGVKGEIQDESNMDAKCVFLCASVNKGLTDESGNINMDRMKEYISKNYSSKMKPDAVILLVEKCAAERDETSPCEKLYQFHKCHMKVGSQL